MYGRSGRFSQRRGWSVNKTEACLNLYQAYRELGEDARAYTALLRGFTISAPSSQACCILGEMFLKRGEYSSAIYWYKSALNAHDDEKSGGFVNRDYGGFIPLMQLCVIYDKMGKLETACAYNEAAGTIKPHNAGFLSNRKYFEKLGIKVDK